MTPLVDVRSDARFSDSGAVAVYLHGFGSNEHDLAGIAPLVTPSLPWASLRAPLLQHSGSFAWFPIGTPGVPDPETVVTATALAWEWIDTHLPASSPIVAIGFSQGGLMASQLLRTRPDRVAATVILGGFVQGVEVSGDSVLADRLPPVFWGRGEHDNVIAPVAIARTQAWLPMHSTPDIRTYPGLAHGINQREIDDVRTFLASIPELGPHC